MAGITDFPFRRIVREFGNFLVFSEMVASQAAIRRVQRTMKMMSNKENDPYTGVQLVGADPYIMSEAAKLCCDLGARFLDINMGCPVKKVVKSDAGSALMKNESLAVAIIEAVVKASHCPVSVKMRLGWKKDNQNASVIAAKAEQAGVSLVTVHGRTRDQLYSGQADWSSIADVKESLKKIPLIVNGDITNTATATEALSKSKADGVMIGRGTLGNPWILQKISFALKEKNLYPCINQSKKEILAKHVEYIFDFYPPETSVKLCRKILMYYFKHIPNASQYRQRALLVESRNDIVKTIDLVEF
jgi:tRNA-dihydrouridine synthase B